MIEHLKRGVIFGLGMIAALVWVACSDSMGPTGPTVPPPPAVHDSAPKPPAPKPPAPPPDTVPKAPPPDTTPKAPPPPVPWQHDPPIACVQPDSVPVAPDTTCILSIIVWPSLNVNDTTQQITQFCAFAKMGRPRGIAPQIWPTTNSEGIAVCDSVGHTLPGYVGP